MDLEAVEQALHQQSLAIVQDGELVPDLVDHGTLKTLVEAVVADWKGTEQQRLLAFGMIKDHIDNLRMTLIRQQEDVVARLQKIHRGKQSVNQYNSLQGK